MSDGFTFWRYRRKFAVDNTQGMVVIRSRSSGLHSELWQDGALLDQDRTPMGGPESVRNHVLSADWSDGSRITVEAGYISSLNVGIAVRRDDTLIYESHPGRRIAYPEKYREQAVALGSGANSDNGIDFGSFKRNRIPLAVDIALGLIFFIVAKLSDLTTAAFIGAGLGVVLLVAQRLTKVDLLGGLAMFGIVMLLLSAALAFAFQSDDAVKYRSTVMGVITATLFFIDGVAGGKRLASRLMTYLPYSDIDPARLGIGMGVMGLVLAGANQAVAMWTSTDVWLFYSTFADFLLAAGMMMLVFQYARGIMLPDVKPAYRKAVPE